MLLLCRPIFFISFNETLFSSISSNLKCCTYNCRCTDGIVFVLDSVDIERMEEAKMELMRTAKCPDNQVNITQV